MAIQLMLNEVQRQQREYEEERIRIRERSSEYRQRFSAVRGNGEWYAANVVPWDMGRIQLTKRATPWYEDLDKTREEIWKSHVEPVIRQLPHLIKADAR